jgi:hypothetical protein
MRQGGISKTVVEPKRPVFVTSISRNESGSQNRNRAMIKLSQPNDDPDARYEPRDARKESRMIRRKTDLLTTFNLPYLLAILPLEACLAELV